VDQIVIRDMQGFSEYNACMRLQREVWTFPDADLVPASYLVVLHHYGGVSLGAFHQGEMVGFVVGFVGWRDGQIFHHSHMLAVVPAYRGRRLGADLKWAQRERVLAQGMSLVNWTFDPLQVLNANFNINLLGATAHKYMVDVYGASDSPLHGGLPTDRFEAEWWIASPRVVGLRHGRRVERDGWERLPRANGTRDLETRFRRSEDEMRLELEDEEVLVEVPGEVTPMMVVDRELALDWRMKPRRIFQAYFARGYQVAGFHRSDGRYYYRLEILPRDSA